MEIEIIYLIAFTLISIVGLGGYLGYLNWFTTISAVVMGFVMVMLISPFTELVITPFGNSLLYGYEWGLYEYAVLVNIILMLLLPIHAMYNLYLSNGKKLWG